MKKGFEVWVLGFWFWGFEGDFVVVRQEGRRGRKAFEGWVSRLRRRFGCFNPKIRCGVFVPRAF